MPPRTPVFRGALVPAAERQRATRALRPVQPRQGAPAGAADGLARRTRRRTAARASGRDEERDECGEGHGDTLSSAAFRVCHALRQSARMFVPAVSPNASWSIDPVALVLLVAVTVVYVRRWRAVRASVGRLVSFLCGIAVAAIALFSPVDSLGEDLFLMHMSQHILLLDIVPILCILGLTA